MKKNWEIKKLGEIAKINYGYTEKAVFESVGPKFLRITDIQNNNVDWNKVPFCKCNEMNLQKYKLEASDIVFARTGATTGKSYLLKSPPESVFASYLIRLKLISKKDFSPEFVSYFFQTKFYWDKINKGISGSAQGGFNATKLGELIFPIPPLPEQKRLVSLLDKAFAAIDKAIANTRKNLQNTRELFDSYLNEIFSKPGDDWGKNKMKDLCEKITDGTHQTPKYFDEGIIFLSSRNVTSRKIDWKNIKYIDKKQHLELQKRVSPKLKDILLAKNGTTGVAAMVDKDVVFDIYVSLAHIRVLDKITPEFMLYFINSPVAKKQFNKRLKGIGVPNLHLKEIREVIVNYPKSKYKQQQITQELDVLSSETKRLESIYQQKLDDLKELKQSILQIAFEGEL